MTDQPELRNRIAEAVRDAACNGDCGKTEEECAKERIQPFVWHHGRLAVVEGTPEQIADAILAVLPTPADRATVLREAADRLDARAAEFTAAARKDPLAFVKGATDARYRTADAWNAAAEELRRMAAESAPAPEADPAYAWQDGDPLMEAIAAAVHELCETGDGGIVHDDPRNIAAAASQAAVKILGRDRCTHSKTIHNTHHTAGTVPDCPWCTTRTAERTAP